MSSWPSWLRRFADNEEIGGSNPSGDTKPSWRSWIAHRTTDAGVGSSSLSGGAFGIWRSSVALRSGGPEVVGSNPAIPTHLGVAQFGRAPASGAGGTGVQIPPPRLLLLRFDQATVGGAVRPYPGESVFAAERSLGTSWEEQHLEGDRGRLPRTVSKTDRSASTRVGFDTCALLHASVAQGKSS